MTDVRAGRPDLAAPRFGARGSGGLLRIDEGEV
jgi:hypothetical protein